MKTSDDTDNKEVIMHYFNSRFKYQSIVHFLKKFHDIVMSVRTLKRRLKEYEADRSKNTTDSAVRNIIMQKIAEGPLPLLGYRSWWNMLRKSYRLKVS